MLLKFLGTGTSQGIPVIGSHHPVCLSKDQKDKRLRTSALITSDKGKKILIDCGPDFRQQMLNNHEEQIDAVLITHEHNDHIIGMDDLRPLIFKNNASMPVYCNARVAKEVRNRFPYAFAEHKYPGAPSFDLVEVNGRFTLFDDLEIQPIDIIHSEIHILGFKMKNLAYITDASHIDDTEKQKLKNLDFFIINCLRKTEPHHSHFILPQVLELVKELKPKKTFLIHISHHLGFHNEVEQELPENVHLAYDGLEIEF
ncbi:phosphoribosyl 1,2-cyclic phosphate phosphodiesterase [Epilithonimonas bovis DSM 19482]|jgi:phosphoribosyl 1,2-cyclic phosphate phosphodiesterase|uniref:Phosphoribosyl 1,2-cyclic phosphate phosphodiesterase n=1 Tax=Epilithonimonas bovis DSM 19482 TaxID=1121284 RepID=A0A1U7Q0D1_9FLAO|nr:MBL fold metallo-hydrolase [Epilithonimonas bovis]SIT97658.1 phosphoribosyl 1,2-cyclic phosphate phosphodiesterase [Epilithonimonas bovis DSM 19482]